MNAGEKKCPVCDGAGESHCEECEGTGIVECGHCGSEFDCRQCGGDGGREACEVCQGTGAVPLSERDLEQLGQLTLIEP